MVASLRSHRTALRLRGVPWLRTVLRSVRSPLQPFGPPPFAKRSCDAPCFIGVFVPACASLARYSGAAERFALSSPLHPFGASTTTACFAHCARPSCAPFAQGRLWGSAASYGCFPQRGAGSEAELRGRPCGLRSVSSGLRLSRALPWVFDGLWPPGFSGGHALWVME